MFEFKDFDYLTDGEIDLRIHEKLPANDEKGFVPAYAYNIYLHNGNKIIGGINIRIGNNELTQLQEYCSNSGETYY